MQMKQEFRVNFQKVFHILGSLEIFYNLEVKIMLKQLRDTRFLHKGSKMGVALDHSGLSKFKTSLIQ